MTEDGVIHRPIYLPSPNEMLAESALLYECSVDRAFQLLPCVYSYHFPKLSSKEGIFQNYFPQFEKRNNFIAEVCENLKDSEAIILYTDIQKFYPSISYEQALKAWLTACDRSTISATSRELGEKILIQYQQISKTHNEGLGILSGPMFSHLVANLVLIEVDDFMSEYMQGRYWRYVDDFVLAGDIDLVRNGRKELSKMLNNMGFSLHDKGKDFEVKSSAWLQENNKMKTLKIDSNLWASLVGNIRRLLISKPEEQYNLKQAFSQEKIKIPLRDYSNLVAESSYREKFFNWLKKYSWAANTVRQLTVDNLLIDALDIKNIYLKHITTILENKLNLEGYVGKLSISKLRFYTKRLSYLAPSDALVSLNKTLSLHPELCLQSKVIQSLYSRDVSSLIKLGTNAVQAAAQILRIEETSVTCSLHSFGEVELQGLAILRLNGIKIKFPENVDNQMDSLNQFALETDLEKLMKSDDLFIKEMACLHGVDKRLRHADILDSAFDRDEELSFDIIDQLQISSYF